MSELVIKKHDFEKSINQLKVFSEQTSQDLGLHRVDKNGAFLGLGNHKVTGGELNSLTSQIQNYLIDFNTLHTKFIKEFGQVYNALEALDKDYIQAILIAIKAAEKANNDVKAAQKDITDTIKIQKKTIEALSQFKKTIDEYKHLADVDKIWSDSQKLQKDTLAISNNIANMTTTLKEKTQELNALQAFKEQIEKIKHLKNVDELWNTSINLQKTLSSVENKIDVLTEKLDSQVQSLEALFIFKEEIESIDHIADIDTLWNDTQNIHNEIVALNTDVKNIMKSVDAHQQTIQRLCEFKAELDKFEHLKDIDVLWDKAEDTKTAVSENGKRINEATSLIGKNKQSIESLMQFQDKVDSYEHLRDVDEMWNCCNIFETNLTSTNEIVNAHQNQIADFETKIQEIQEKNEERNQANSKKIKIAYALAGSSMGIAIIELVLMVMRIL